MAAAAVSAAVVAAAAAAPLSRAHIFVSGKVQGVYYRDSTKLKGARLGLTGIAYNLPDTRVEVIAEGSKASIDELIQWCWKGPEGAAEVGVTKKLTLKRKVTNVEVTWEYVEESDRRREFAEFVNGGNKTPSS